MRVSSKARRRNADARGQLVDERIGYTADLRLPGPLRVFEPLLGKRFQTLADDAMAGLRRALA